MELQTNGQPHDRKLPKKKKSRRKFRKYYRVILLAAVLGVSISSGVEMYNRYNNPSIEGEWISSETGRTVEFTKSGKVKVEQVQIGTYIMTAPDSMVYHIEDQEFDMYYKLNKRSLIWGIIGEEEELFERKQQWGHFGLDIFS